MRVGISYFTVFSRYFKNLTVKEQASHSASRASLLTCPVFKKNNFSRCLLSVKHKLDWSLTHHMIFRSGERATADQKSAAELSVLLSPNRLAELGS